MSNLYEIKTIGVQGAVLEYAEFATKEVAIFSCRVHHGTKLLTIKNVKVEDGKVVDYKFVYTSDLDVAFEEASKSLNLDAVEVNDDE